jgi:hypothetical protein
MNQNPEAERILKEHRKWTQWIAYPRILPLGNLVLTNRRLIFLNKIQSSPQVTENIKKLADAPMETVLNYAFTLNRDNFQIPLSAIGAVRVGAFRWNPFPHVCLSVVYFDGKNTSSRLASFQFIRPIKQTILHPQLFVDIGWVRAINRAIKENESHS